LGRGAEAGRLTAETIESARRRKDHYRLGAVLLNEAARLIHQFAYDQALRVSQQAAEAARAAGARQILSVALFNKALCLYSLGDHESAARVAEEMNQASQTEDIPSVRMINHRLNGQLRHALGDHDRAIEHYRQAFASAEITGQPDRMADSASTLASLYLQQRAIDEAGRWNEKARKAVPTGSPYEVNIAINSALLAKARGDAPAAITILGTTVAKQDVDPELRWDGWYELARIYRDRGQLPEAHRCYREGIRMVEKTQRTFEEEFQAPFLSRLIRGYQEYVALLLQRKEEAEAFAVEESSRARVLSHRLRTASPAPLRAGLAELRKLARREDVVLLSYWISELGSHVWVASAAGIRRIDLRLEPARLASVVETHRDEIEKLRRDPVQSNTTSGKELFEVLIAPVRDWIPKNAHVIIVPDGPLHGLNFETLVVGQPAPHYWIEDVTVSVAASHSMLTGEQPASRKSGERLLLVGDAVPSDEFPRLAHAGQEVRALANLFGPSRIQVREGAAATPASFLEAGPGGFSYIHFATHAKASRDAPLDSAVILSGPPHRYKLYARDVMNLDLSADLVTVSACQSAGARAYQGEGMIGFAWAFLRAGAHNVIAGLWDVSDRSTAELMQDMYTGLLRSQSPAQSLRAAKLRLIASGGNYRKPVYWAPFLLYTRQLKRQAAGTHLP